MLYLYRRAALNAGHGKYRGGHGIVFALCGHRTSNQLASTISVVSSLSTHSGLFGGHWGETGTYYGVTGSDIQHRLAAGNAPAAPAELRQLPGATAGTLPAKTVAHALGEADAIEESVFGGGGYGDPLERDPDAVAADVAALLVPASIATDIYGVVLDTDGNLQSEATSERRRSMLAERLEIAYVENRYEGTCAAPFSKIVDVAERLAIGRFGLDGELLYVCTGCDAPVCVAAANYKLWSGRIDTSLQAIDANVFTDPALEIDANVVYRMFVCPHCGIAFENELTLEDEPPFHDIAIDLDTLEQRS